MRQPHSQRSRATLGGNLQNRGFRDYLVPTAGGVPAAVMAAVEDARAPFGACLNELPLSPERVLSALAARDR